ncbi:MAG: MFS transporter, partial [Acidimicrobiales bacterium]
EHDPAEPGVPAGGDPELERLARHRPLVLAAVLLAVLVVSMDNSILYVALKTLAEPAPTGLGASQSQLQWAVDAYALAYAGLLLSAGVVGNRSGHKRLLLIGLVCFASFSALSAFSQHPAELIACRAALGLSAALIMPATLAIVTNVFPGEARAQAIGIWSAVVGAALAIGPVVAGALLTHFWWGSVFLVNVPVVAVALVAMSALIPEFREHDRRHLDPLGIALSAGGLLAVVYGVIRAGDLDRWTTPEVYLPVAAGLLFLGMFAGWERRVDHPTLDVRYFRNRGFSASVIALAMLFFALFGGTFVLTFYLQSVRGDSALHAGLCILPLAGAMIAFAPQAPALVRRFGARAVSTTGMLIVATALLGLATLQRATAIWQFEVILFVFGAGMSCTLPPTTAQIVATLPEDEAGTSSAVNNTFRQVGGSIGIAALGSVLAGLYRSRIGPELGVLPAGVRPQAESSVTATLQALHAAGARAHALVLPVEDAFMHAMHLTWLVAAIVVAAGAVVIFLVFRSANSAAKEATPARDSAGSR